MSIERVSTGLYRDTSNQNLLQKLPGTAQAFVNRSTGELVSQRQFRVLRGHPAPKASKGPSLYKQWISGFQNEKKKAGQTLSRNDVRKSPEFKRIWKLRNSKNKRERLLAAQQAGRTTKPIEEYLREEGTE